MNEASKSLIRRMHDVRFVNTYFTGVGIDIGCGDDPISKYNKQFPLMTGLMPWDLQNGDAQYLESVSDDTFDFVHSSHCLEHMVDPYVAFSNWIRVCKPGGYLVITIPDEDLYEQGIFPSTFNLDHKTTWTISKVDSWSPKSINLMSFLSKFESEIQVLKLELIDTMFRYDEHRYDQTYVGISECAIEFVVRKKTKQEVLRKGRLPL